MAVQESLQTYRKKRDFSHTPEPRGGRKAAEHGLFVIQKHAASHLHYDFRLELGGVLKSWAVPKGPSCDPQEKRLARHVEDHPVEYGGFEGIIPKGQYGGGTVLLWDRGKWEPEGDPNQGYRRGRLKFRLHGDKLHGGYALVRMRGDDGEDRNWLLIKERDSEAGEGDIVAERPESVLSGRTIEEIAADPEAAEWTSNREESKKGTNGARHNSAKAHNGAKHNGAKANGAKGAKPAAIKARTAAAMPAGARRAAMPDSVDTQLATLVTAAPAGDAWLYEMKLDGYRMVAYVEDGAVRLETRTGQDWTARFPSVAKHIAALEVRSAVLDGEVVVLRPDGVSDFQALQNAMKEHASGVVYFAFDLLYLDGHDLRGAALSARKQALSELLAGHKPGDVVRYSDHIAGGGAIVLEKACELGVEGVIAKEKDRPYLAGRAGSWLKIKCHHRQELVIGGFTPPSGSRVGLGALLLGYHDKDGNLVYAGKVGTGFSGKLLQELRARLDKIETEESSFADEPRLRGAHWVKPQLVVEVRFAGWTRGGRVRQGAFQGMREDREASTVVRETAKPVSVVKARAARAESSGAKSKTAAHSKTAKAKPRTATHDKPSSGKTASDKPSSGKTASDKAAHGAARSKAAGGKTAGGEAAHVVAGIKISHPDKVLYPEQGITKGQLADYYAKIAPHILPLISRRPLTLVRCPEGQGKPCFFQKHAGLGTSEHIGQVPIKDSSGKKTYLYVESEAGLLSLVQMGALELHTWGSHIDDLEQPDLLVFDLDPGPGVDWTGLVVAARTTRILLDALGLESFVKTTGGKGLHVVVPVQPEHDWDQIKAFTKGVATALERADPDRYIASMSKAKREGRIFVDYLRNGRGATAVTPYSTRARPGGYVAMPVAWDELGAIEPSTFTIESAPKRLARGKNPWQKLPSVRQSITAAMIRKVGA